MTQETEIKLAIGEASEARLRIERIGFTESKARVFERNLVFDLPDGALQHSRRLLRLREAGETATLTFKGVPIDGGVHKSREERETSVGSFGEMRTILERLGYGVTFVYEKFRTEFHRAGQNGTVTLDETPIGNYLELEGDSPWIDATAPQLGFSLQDYVTASYGRLYADWCAAHGIAPANMQFP